MLNKKVAVCFSGQIRDWQVATKIFYTIFPTDLSPCNSRFFYAYMGHKYVEKTQIVLHVCVLTQLHKDLTKIVETYKSKNIICPYDAKRWPDSEPWIPLFYSFEYSILLKQQYELENNFTYDIVVKALKLIQYTIRATFSSCNIECPSVLVIH